MTVSLRDWTPQNLTGRGMSKDHKAAHQPTRHGGGVMLDDQPIRFGLDRFAS